LKRISFRVSSSRPIRGNSHLTIKGSRPFKLKPKSLSLLRQSGLRIEPDVMIQGT